MLFKIQTVTNAYVIYSDSIHCSFQAGCSAHSNFSLLLPFNTSSTTYTCLHQRSHNWWQFLISKNLSDSLCDENCSCICLFRFSDLPWTQMQKAYRRSRLVRLRRSLDFHSMVPSFSRSDSSDLDIEVMLHGCHCELLLWNQLLCIAHVCVAKWLRRNCEVEVGFINLSGRFSHSSFVYRYCCYCTNSRVKCTAIALTYCLL